MEYHRKAGEGARSAHTGRATRRPFGEPRLPLETARNSGSP